jgi:hypothetical protein
VVYHVHALEGCDCPEVKHAPDQRCRHWWGATLVALAHSALAAQQYVTEPVRPFYLAISLDPETYDLPILGEPQKDGSWWAQTYDGASGWYTETLRLVAPLHQLQWQCTVHA